MECNLLAGAARAVHWSDITQKDLRLCLRLQETGQQWSGGFALDTPGDLFVKIRHRSALPSPPPPHCQPCQPCNSLGSLAAACLPVERLGLLT